MLTIFAIPKEFRDEFSVIQRNAVRSWTLLGDGVEIILFGDEVGTAELAAELKLRHIPQIKRNEYGTPLISDLFEKAQKVASHDLICYVNSDIILMSDFPRSALKAAAVKRSFVMTGLRWDLQVKELLDFGAGWENALRLAVEKSGRLEHPAGMDYFIFRRWVWGEIPPFAIGRTVWDNWLLYRARALRVPVIDATGVILAVHQDHTYSHLPEQAGNDAWKGPEAKRNRELAGGHEHVFTLEDATHKLTSNGIKRDWSWKSLHKRLERVPALYPNRKYLAKLAWHLRKHTASKLKP